MKRLNVVLICDAKDRELSGLEYTAEQLKKDLQAKVTIIGSLAENQRMFFLLSRLKPDIVFISQIQEKILRDIAKYVKESGGIICVIPNELTYLKSNFAKTYFNSRLSYDSYVDFYFLPGKQMEQDLKKYSDISKDKFFIVGSPRMDLLSPLIQETFLDRKSFCKKHSIPVSKKNIFIFTNFADVKEEYLQKEEAYIGQVKEVAEIYHKLRKTREAYFQDIPKLCTSFPKFNFIIKPHPLEDVNEYKKIKAKNLYIVANENYNNTLQSIDLEIHWNSTTATECWIKGKKTIQYVPVSGCQLNEFSCGNPVFYNFEDLKQGIRRYIDKPLEKTYINYQQKYISTWYFKIDGKSYERITKILKAKRRNKFFLNRILKEKNYRPGFDKSWIVVEIVEKFLGIGLTRRLVSLFKRNYEWSYASRNYVFIEKK